MTQASDHPFSRSDTIESGRTRPKVSIGLPVFNGEKYVGAAIESMLEQTFTDFELVISDNASTDRTESICRAWADRDPRIRYFRNDRNVGASANYTRVFERSRGEYFKWTAHDDVYAETYLEKCVAVLDHEPDTVLCHARRARINAEGELLRIRPKGVDIVGPTPHERFRSALAGWYYVWGLVRRDVLAQTKLLGAFVHHDFALISRLSLFGNIRELPKILCFFREHADQYSSAFDAKEPSDRLEWFDPNLKGSQCFVWWRLLREHSAGVVEAPISMSEKLRCIPTLLKWCRTHRIDLWKDLVTALGRVRFLGPAILQLEELVGRRRWYRTSRQMVRQIHSRVPSGHTVILVDDGVIGKDALQRLRAVPFPEKDGQYAGPPPTDEAAIAELERLRNDGACFIAFVKPSMWWLDYYLDLHSYLRDRATCIHENDLAVVYELTPEPDIAATVQRPLSTRR